MGASIVWKIDPVKTVDEYKAKLNTVAMRKAMNKASAPTKAQVVSKSPVFRNYLNKAIRIRLQSYRNKSVWVSIIGPKADFIKNKGIWTKGKRKGEPRRYRPAKYARLVEKGHGGKHPARAHPFLDPAMKETAQTYLDLLTEAIKSETEKMLPKG